MPAGFADGVDDESDSFAALGVSCMDGETPVWDAVIVEWACGIDMVLSESEVDAMVADNGYATTTDTEALLERIEQLENQLAEVADDGDDSDSSTVMYGDYNINNSADLNALSGFSRVSLSTPYPVGGWVRSVVL